MPSETFFRLPEEKRERVIRSAWQEFTSVSYAQVSINRIVRQADIPRGSFYQYFADKDDLFRYLAGGIRDYAVEGYAEVLRGCGGDMFQAALSAYDSLRELRGTAGVEPIDRALKFIRINPDLDIQKLLTWECGERCLDPIWEVLDPRRLRRERYMRTGYYLCILSLGHAAMDVLARPERWEENRAWLAEAIEIIKFGCAAEAGASPEGAQL